MRQEASKVMSGDAVQQQQQNQAGSDKNRPHYWCLNNKCGDAKHDKNNL